GAERRARSRYDHALWRRRVYCGLGAARIRAVSSLALEHAGHSGTRCNADQTQEIAGDDVQRRYPPLSLFEKREGFIRVRREGRVRATKPDRDEQAPPRIGEHALGCPDKKEAQDKASGRVDEQRGIGKSGGADSRDVL